MDRRHRLRRVSVWQLETLCEYLNSHRDLATAHNRSMQAKEYAKVKWKEIAKILNSCEDGTYKDWRGWSKYWVDYKAKIKIKLAAAQLSHGQTEGGSSMDKLSDIDQKFLKILEKDSVQNVARVKMEPFLDPSGRSGSDTLGVGIQDSSTSDPIHPRPTVSKPLLLTIEPLETSNQDPQDQKPLKLFKNNFSAHVTNPLANLPASSLNKGPTHSPNSSPAESPNNSPAHSSNNSPAHSPTRTPSISSRSATRSPLLRRRRRQPPMSTEAARRAMVRATHKRAQSVAKNVDVTENLVRFSRMYAEAAVRSSKALEKLARFSQIHAEAAVKSSKALEKLVHLTEAAAANIESMN